MSVSDERPATLSNHVLGSRPIQAAPESLVLCFLQMPPAANPEIVFYDGHCALCHGAVKFILKRDRGTAFHFAPLQGATFESRIAPELRAALPDSVAVLTCEGKLLTRSDAFLHILRELGGGWKILAGIFSVIPCPIRDAVYNGIAKIRYRVFGTRDELCPIVPAEIRARFEP
jgi:predicted DCC family thiol-disulfide oxidoreductase YuxK